MDLVKSWLGQALRATGAAIVIPIAVLVALSLSAVGGTGLGGLGALSQIVSGPQVAGSEVRVDDGDSEISDAVTRLAARGGGGGASTGGTAPRGDAPAGGQQTGGDAPRTPGSPPPANGPPETTQPPNDNGGNGGGGGGSPAPPAEPPPPEAPGVVDGLGDGVKDVTSGTPVAPTIEDAVDTLVETCGRLGCP